MRQIGRQGRMAGGFASLVLALVWGSTARMALAQPGPVGATLERADEMASFFAFPGEKIILEECHCGIVNGRLAIGTPFKDIAGIDGVWAPPYVSSDFRLAVTINGEKLACNRYVWRPYRIDRWGEAGHVRIASSTVLAAQRRAGVVVLRLDNPSDEARQVAIEFCLDGSLDRTEAWEFDTARSRSATKASAEDGLLILNGDHSAIVVQSNGRGLHWSAVTRCGKTTVVLPAHGSSMMALGFAVGEKAEAIGNCKSVTLDPEATLRIADANQAAAVRTLLNRLPDFRSDSAALVQFYRRSLVHLLMNRWDVPEFVLHPYYSTGSVRGGCLGNYLWNFGEVWEILPLADPRATREHIKQFLALDLTAHFALNPMTGKAFGPWYMVNQEKIVGLIYYYVKLTGDRGFLQERVRSKTVLEHSIANATFGDDLSKPVATIDYGPSNCHLELRRGYPYNHKMPDLNGRRYASYLKAARLAAVAGKPAPALQQRAEAVRAILKRQAWNPQTRWFDFFDAGGGRQTRYTIQIFKLFGSGVLDAEEEAGLLSHLNPREFLSEFGLHSLSKTDPAYDAIDIDNGGGGSCTGFMPQIAERLYKSGYPEAAEDLLRRVLWWGQRMPYWGDSLVASAADYRKDTPLQCTIDGAAVAQCVLFGMFGIEARFDGSIRVRPRPAKFARRMELRGLKLLGVVLDIDVADRDFEVRAGGRLVRARVGETVVIQGDRLSVSPLPPAAAQEL
jgi:hypothetical protein